MKESIIVLFFFSVGVLGGRLDLLPAGWLGLVHEASNLAVYAMLAAVGMSLGFDSRAWRILRDLKGWVVLVPLMIIVGTFLGGVAAWAMLDMSFRDVMAVAAGRTKSRAAFSLRLVLSCTAGSTPCAASDGSLSSLRMV